MISDIKFIEKDPTYIEVKELLESSPHIHAFPLVQNKGTFFFVSTIENRRLLSFRALI